jgi:protoporphyrin/coproporphyrin ferrochelatase
LGAAGRAWQYSDVTMTRSDGVRRLRDCPLAPYDAVVLLSFGGPEAPEEVMPFLRNVTRGRGIPDRRLEQVAQHYLRFGGRSPINDENRTLLVQIRADLAAQEVDVSVYWGNRNWDPFVVDALRQAHEDGARRVLVAVTSAYPSYSGCRQYREDLAGALIALAAEGRELAVDKVRHYANHPGFLEPVADAVIAGLARVPEGSHVVFVTHSIPVAMADAAGPEGGAYTASHRQACRGVVQMVAGRLGSVPEWDLAYCSRSGPPSQPWLEPDVNDHLRALSEAGVPGVVVVPVGFVSDHMEVVFDLDTQARTTARNLGLPFVRVPTAGRDRRFASGLTHLLLERAAAERGEEPHRPAIGAHGPWHDVCPVGCCRNLRAPDTPAACGEDWGRP